MLERWWFFSLFIGLLALFLIFLLAFLLFLHQLMSVREQELFTYPFIRRLLAEPNLLQCSGQYRIGLYGTELLTNYKVRPFLIEGLLIF